MQSGTTSQDQSGSPSLARFLRDRYPAVKAQYPGEGRRKWRLRAAEAFWELNSDEKIAYLASNSADPGEDADFVTDDDPLDEISDDAPGLGIVLRTDYSNEDAWQAFCGKLQEGEAEFAPERPSEGDRMDQDAGGPSNSGVADDDAMDQDEDDMGEGESEGFASIFSVIDASPADRARFTHISNLSALRLLNDVDVRRAPSPPVGTKRIKPPNRLVDHHGWQEIYTGKMVWIYDAKSNVDQCVRLVSQQSGPYGTATADSWRARVGHICELQVNLATGAMTIDFGGLDKWDYEERVRNMEEVHRSIS